MARSQHSRQGSRATRVKLLGSVLALVELQNGRHVRARLHQLSTTGGVLQVTKPLDEGIAVKLIFHVGSTTVRSNAQMLFPMWATRGCLQPFRFTDLDEDDRGRLATDLQTLLEKPPASTE